MVSLNAHFWNISEKDKDCDSFWTTQLALTGLCFSDLSMGRVPKSLMGFRRKSSTPCSEVTQIPLLSSSFLLFASRAQHSSFEPLYPGDDGSFDFFKWNMLFHIPTRSSHPVFWDWWSWKRWPWGICSWANVISKWILRETFHIWIIMKWTGKKAAPAGRNLQTWFVNQSTNGSSMLARSFKHKEAAFFFTSASFFCISASIEMLSTVWTILSLPSLTWTS